MTKPVSRGSGRKTSAARGTGPASAAGGSDPAASRDATAGGDATTATGSPFGLPFKLPLAGAALPFGTGLPFGQAGGQGAGGQDWLAMARQMRGWADAMAAAVGPVTDLAFAAASAQARDDKERAGIQRAGSALRELRERAGFTLKDVSQAVDLRSPGLLEQVEGGAATLPFELILRLAAVLGRDDPVTAMTHLTRSCNPDLWQTFDQLGFGRLMVQAGRERELANLYRANDDARRLDDDDFARVLAFTRQAFDMAVTFRTAPAAAAEP